MHVMIKIGTLFRVIAVAFGCGLAVGVALLGASQL